MHVSQHFHHLFCHYFRRSRAAKSDKLTHSCVRVLPHAAVLDQTTGTPPPVENCGCIMIDWAPGTATEARTEGVLGQNGSRSLSCRIQRFEMKLARLTNRWSPSLRQVATRRSSADVRQTDHEGPFDPRRTLGSTTSLRAVPGPIPTADFPLCL